MFPFLAASISALFAFDNGLEDSAGCAASTTGSAGFASGAGDDCCDSPHPTRSTAAIVVRRRCLITRVSNLLITNDLIFECFLGHTFGHTFSPSSLKTLKHKENDDFSMFAATILIYLNLQRQPQIRFLYLALGVEESAICGKITPLQ